VDLVLALSASVLCQIDSIAWVAIACALKISRKKVTDCSPAAMASARHSAIGPKARYTCIVNQIADRITVDPEQCGGRPCVRGMRIRVSDVLDLFASGLSAAEILDEMPDLEAEDLQACLRFASRYLDHPVLVA